MRHLLLSAVGALALSLGFTSTAAAQSQFPPPAGPVTICGTQAAPTAASYQLIFDGGAPEAVTLTAPAAACPLGSTHSFTLPAARFTVGVHSVVVRATNAFGSTNGPSYAVSVGIAPGSFTVGAVIPGE